MNIKSVHIKLTNSALTLTLDGNTRFSLLAKLHKRTLQCNTSLIVLKIRCLDLIHKTCVYAINAFHVQLVLPSRNLPLICNMTNCLRDYLLYSVFMYVR